ncbi:DHH family phosphoesterase [Candidatus Woesearchaeota archaeon]|nr:DHH family phosphoesterase [Candidatus Woesearchaeota archaeon]
MNRILQQEAVDNKIVIVRKELNIFRLNSQPLSFTLTFSGDFKIPKLYRKESYVYEFLKKLNIDGKKTFSQIDGNQQKKLVNAIKKITPFHLRKYLFSYHILIHPNLLNDEGKLYEAKEISTYLNGLSRLFNVKLGIDFCLDLCNNLTEVKIENKKYKSQISNAMKIYYDMRANGTVFENDLIIYINYKDKLNPNLVGILSSMLTKGGIEQTKKIVIISAYQKNNFKLSFRVHNKSNYNLNNLARKLVENYGGEAGGHKQASGAVTKKEHEEEIIKKIKQIDENILNSNF